MKIQRALVSVYHKTSLQPILREFARLGIEIISTGGTQRYIEELGYKAQSIENLTGYPSILNGRVKTLHPTVFGGILGRRDEDTSEMQEYDITGIDLVIVDLYPFEQTVEAGKSHAEIIENIDIGGISLIRAAAKNYKDVVVIPSVDYYENLLTILQKQDGNTTPEERQQLAAAAFGISSGYDNAVFNHMTSGGQPSLSLHSSGGRELRYGENPHQNAHYFGDLDSLFEQVQGKALSYNNLVDVDAAIRLIEEFDETTFVIIKHTNPCGVASRDRLLDAWKAALAGDPVSAFGGIFVTNQIIDKETAEAIDELFFEVLIAPEFEQEALQILGKKTNRILLKKQRSLTSQKEIKSALDGYLQQDRDLKTETLSDLKFVTKTEADPNKNEDLLFATKVVKHAKSNTIVLAKNKQLTGIGVGQTSRVDALKQAVDKARHFELPLQGSVMASDAFFPFSDSVQLAHEAGIDTVIQPGGSKRDQDSIDYCDEHGMAMAFTGTRHFKH